MRFITPVLFFLAGVLSVHAEPLPTPHVARELTAASREDALEKILTERGPPDDFQKLLKHAASQGVGEQAMLEARFLYQVDQGDEASIAALLPEFTKQQQTFSLDDSVIFSVEEEWLSVVEYVRALDALVKNDKQAFKKHITEAYWLNPEQAAAFAPHIEKYRMQESMNGLTIDLSTACAPLTGDQTTTIGELLKDKKALLLHFWSPWSRECADTMPDFAATARMLTDKGVAVASLIRGDMPELAEEARMLISSNKAGDAGEWLVDPKSGSLSRKLRVRKLPTMVIVKIDGSVFYNGDPACDEFWDALHKIDGKIVRPESDGGR